MSPHPDCESVLLSRGEIASKVEALGQSITRDYREREPLLVGVLRGCVVFLSDLMREIDRPLEVDFLAVGSYGQSTNSSGVVRVLKDLDEDIEGRHVVLVEDIVDTGLTLNFLRGYLESRNPATLSICALLDKPARRQVEVDVTYTGFEVPDRFLVGYGLDYAQKYRNLPYVGVLDEEELDD